MKRKSLERTGEYKRIDPYNLLTKEGIELIEAGHFWKARCPLPDHEDKEPSFYVHKFRGRWHCFGCKRFGSLEELIAILKNITVAQARDMLYGKHFATPWLMHIYGDLASLQEATIEHEVMPQVLVPPLTSISVNNSILVDDRAYRYALKRNISPHIIVKYDLFVTRDDMYVNRLCIPIYFQGKCRGWIARDITDQDPKRYLNARGMQGERLLFNLDELYNIGIQSHVLLVEGPLDALRILSVDPNAPVLALMKSDLSPVQAYWLHWLGVRMIVLGLDNDEPGREAAQHIARQVKDEFKVALCLPPKKDWGECTDQEIRDSLPVKIKINDKIDEIEEMMKELEG